MTFYLRLREVVITYLVERENLCVFQKNFELKEFLLGNRENFERERERE